MSVTQKRLFDEVKEFLCRKSSNITLNWVSCRIYNTKANIAGKDRQFLIDLLLQLGIAHSIDIPDGVKKNAIITISFGEEDDESDEESCQARLRVLKKFDSARVMSNSEIIAEQKLLQKKAIEIEFWDFKRNYYKV